MAVTTEQFKERLYTFWRRLDVNLVKPVAKTLGIEIPKRTTAREVVLKIVDATIQAGFDFILSDLGVEGTTLFTTCLGGDCGIFAEKLTTNDFIEVINEFSPTNTKEMAAFMMPEMDLLDLTLAQLRESIAAEFVLAGVATVLDKLDDATFKAVHATYINVDLAATDEPINEVVAYALKKLIPSREVFWSPRRSPVKSRASQIDPSSIPTFTLPEVHPMDASESPIEEESVNASTTESDKDEFFPGMTKEDIGAKKFRTLQAFLKKNGCKSSGKTSDLIDRVYQYLESKKEQQTPAKAKTPAKAPDTITKKANALVNESFMNKLTAPLDSSVAGPALEDYHIGGNLDNSVNASFRDAKEVLADVSFSVDDDSENAGPNVETSVRKSKRKASLMTQKKPEPTPTAALATRRSTMAGTGTKKAKVTDVNSILRERNVIVSPVKHAAISKVTHHLRKTGPVYENPTTV